jgi:release factor glutamine methyltransferase
MNLSALKHHFKQEITHEEVETLFYMTVEKISGWGRTKVILNPEQEVTAAEMKAYQAVISQLKLGKPIQYILGEAYFYGLTFKVNPAVLIPRAETEELVDWIIDEVKDLPAGSLLDIGTGSGCIAISLKNNLKEWDVAAIDNSAEALAVAAQNAINQGLNVNFITADALNYSSPQKYEVIVSNPPYVKEDEREAMNADVVDHEPHSALFVSNDNPLVFYKAIADLAISNLEDNGYLFFEINEYLGPQTVSMLNQKGFQDIVLKKDMQGKDRMICCRYRL